METLFVKLEIKLQEAKPIPFTKLKNVTQGNLKATKQPLMEMILLNLNIISACFPLVKGSASHSQAPYISPEIPITAVFWFAQTSLERQGQTSRSFSFGASFRTQ